MSRLDTIKQDIADADAAVGGTGIASLTHLGSRLDRNDLDFLIEMAESAEKYKQWIGSPGILAAYPHLDEYVADEKNRLATSIYNRIKAQILNDA
jgi:hypothetical protein